MSADNDAGPVVAEEGTVAVEKAFDVDSFPLPTVVVTVTNRGESPASVSLVDHVPDGVPMSDVGFHPDYGADHWEAHLDLLVESVARNGGREHYRAVSSDRAATERVRGRRWLAEHDELRAKVVAKLGLQWSP